VRSSKSEDGALAQNSGGTPRVRGRPFRPGQSGNPGGRPKGLVETIRASTQDGQELVQFMLQLFRGEMKGARMRDRMEAATWLCDRGFGKPAQAIEALHEQKVAVLDLRSMTDDQLDALATHLKAMEEAELMSPRALPPASADHDG
jgi:predicted nucleic acid-binding Zn ribbon protein